MAQKYRVVIEMSYVFFREIDAENMEDAWEIARDADRGFFGLEGHDGNWSVYEVYEIEEGDRK